MKDKIIYSDLLNDILEEQINNCQCPVKYMTRLHSQKAKSNNEECYFGTNCEFSTFKNNKSEYTCEIGTQKTQTTMESCVKNLCTKPQCICVSACLCKSDELLIQNSYKPNSCDKSVCICAKTCMCKSDESITHKLIPDDNANACYNNGISLSRRKDMLLAKHNASSYCDKYICSCGGTCFCKSEESRKSYKPPILFKESGKSSCTNCLNQKQHNSMGNLFPTSLRNTIKKEVLTIMVDEKIKMECDEIKKIITDHKAEMKIEPERSIQHKHFEGTNKEVKQIHNTKEDKNVKVVPSTDNVALPLSTQIFDNKTSLEPNPAGDFKSPLPENIQRKSRMKSYTSSTDDSKHIKKIRKKSNKKKNIEVKHQQTCSEKSKSTRYSWDKTYVESRPPKIRYYYSGNMEHYGVKLGHKHCQNLPQLVPKHMGWLWNIEAPGKGIRERKGWPPGFIGKNIKNMIKVLKKFSEQDTITTKKEEVHLKKWDTAIEVDEISEHRAEPPLIHVHKKGRVYNITFCPKNSDDDVRPIPIPFSITQKKHSCDTESSESTLEFELHSPKPQQKNKLLKGAQKKLQDGIKKKTDSETVSGLTETVAPSSVSKTVATRKN